MPRTRPKGPGRDLSQRPRREAPGMLTGMAILERDLGMTEHKRHRLQRQLEGRLAKSEADRLRAQLQELDLQRERTLRLLDDLAEQYENRAQGAA